MKFYKLLNRISADKASPNNSFPLFRGVSDSKHTLLPGLFRNPNRTQFDEENFHCDFTSFGGIILDPHRNTELEILFEMQHAGLPTRLLDWTSSFAMALYFALKDNTHNPCVWMLNPFELNMKSISVQKLPDITSLEYECDSGNVTYVVSKRNKKVLQYPMALVSPMRTPRILAQKSFFTIHGKSCDPIEKICPACVEKYEITKGMMKDAKQFLEFAWVNEYSAYPDLDGLARHLKKEYKY